VNIEQKLLTGRVHGFRRIAHSSFGEKMTANFTHFSSWTRDVPTFYTKV